MNGLEKQIIKNAWTVRFPTVNGQRTPQRIAPKQFQRMTDLAAAWIADLDNYERESDLIAYQDEIGWPWRASQEQIDYWNDCWRTSWDSLISEKIAYDRRKTCGEAEAGCLQRSCRSCCFRPNER